MSKMEEKGKEKGESASRTLSDHSDGNGAQKVTESLRAPDSPITIHSDSKDGEQHQVHASLPCVGAFDKPPVVENL